MYMHINIYGDSMDYFLHTKTLSPPEYKETISESF